MERAESINKRSPITIKIFLLFFADLGKFIIFNILATLTLLIYQRVDTAMGTTIKSSGIMMPPLLKKSERDLLYSELV